MECDAVVLLKKGTKQFGTEMGTKESPIKVDLKPFSGDNTLNNSFRGMSEVGTAHKSWRLMKLLKSLIARDVNAVTQPTGSWQSMLWEMCG